jgi:hypothetical protein
MKYSDINIPAMAQYLLSNGCLVSHHVTILSSHLCLGLLGGLFLSGFLTRTLYTFLYPPMHSACLAHLILSD